MPSELINTCAYSFTVEELLATDWEPIIEKKKKTVVTYQAVFERALRSGYFVHDVLFDSEVSAKTYDSRFIKLLTDRPIDIEVDDE